MKILIVEDEIGISQFLSIGLKEEGFFVDSVADGIQGLEMALTKEYDLIILDWMLPGKSGIEICKEFRKSDSKTPVIFLTAKDAIQNTIQGLEFGANDYIKKPFQFEELLARIQVQLRNHQNDAKIIQINNVTLNPITHQVFLGKEEISLTKKEFDLLHYLLNNKDEVCLRTAIIKDVWNIHFEYNTGVIDVYISSIRKKLRLSRENDFIKTIRGIGFIIN